MEIGVFCGRQIRFATRRIRRRRSRETLPTCVMDTRCWHRTIDLHEIGQSYLDIDVPCFDAATTHDRVRPELALADDDGFRLSITPQGVSCSRVDDRQSGRNRVTFFLRVEYQPFALATDRRC